MHSRIAFLMAAGHVDRDRADRVTALAQELEERFERLGVAAGHHTIAPERWSATEVR
jgi:hypothetical protein